MASSVTFELRQLEAEEVRPEFSCGDDDLDEFFHKDSIAHGLQLLCVNYVLEVDGEVVAFFSLLNDAIRKEDVQKRSELRRFLRLIPRPKHYSSMPAVKIGRLGVAKKCQGKGYGQDILDYLKVWFTHGNKTGCRFIVVDA